MATGFDQANKPLGEEDFSDEKRLLQNLREKYYATPLVVQPVKTTKENGQKEGGEPQKDPVQDEEVLTDEDVDVQDMAEEDEECQDERPNKMGSFWSVLKAKLKEWVEEV